MSLIPASTLKTKQQKNNYKIKRCKVCNSEFRPTSGKQICCKNCKLENRIIKPISPQYCKEIKNYKDYVINKDGKIFSLKNSVLKVLIQSKNSSGFSTVSLYKNGNKKTFLVHKLVLQTFEPLYKNQKILFKDGNKQNTNYYNLEIIFPTRNF